MLTQILSLLSMTAMMLTVFFPMARAQESDSDKIVSNPTCPQAIQNTQARLLEFTPPTYEPQSIPENLNTANAWQIVGEHAVATGDFHNALQAYNKAIDLSGGQNPELLEQRGWAYYIQDNYDRAIADLKAAARLYRERDNRVARTDACQMIAFVEYEQDSNS